MSRFSFFNPGYLWALLFLIPVLLIHLLRKPKTIRLDFSTLRFFSETALRKRNARRLRKILLLLARLLAVAALALIFSRPFDQSNPFSILRNPQASFFIWVDPTISMEYQENGMSLRQRTDEIIDSLRALFPATAKLFMYDETAAEFAYAAQSAPRNTVSRYGRADLNEVFREMQKVQGESESAAMLFLFSDFQEPISRQLDTIFARPDTLPAVIGVSLRPHAPWNYSVSAAPLQQGTTGALDIRIDAAGKALDSGDIAVTVNGIRAGHQNVSAKKNDSASFYMDIPADLTGTSGLVTLGNVDPLAFDNVDYFSPGSRGVPRVVIVGDLRENFVISAALRAADANYWHAMTSRSGAELTYDDIDSADLIVVNALTSPSKVLDAFVNGTSMTDKAIVFALGTSEQSFGWSRQILDKVQKIPELHVVPVADGASPILPDTLSALWRGFPLLRIQEASVYQYAENIPGTPLLRLDRRGGGTPLISHFMDRAERSWVVIGTGLGISSENNLCETGFYVPLLDRLCRYSMQQLRTTTSNWYAGHTRKNPYYGTGIAASVLNDKGNLIASWQHQPSVIIDEPGIYQIVPEGKASYWIAVRSDPDESRLDYRFPEIGSELKKGVKLIDQEHIGEFLREHSTAGISIWLWVVLAAMLAAEVLLWERQEKGRRDDR